MERERDWGECHGIQEGKLPSGQVLLCKSYDQ